MSTSAQNWIPILGSFSERHSDLVFEGKLVQVGQEGDQRETNSLGIALTNRRFRGGKVAATIEFADVDDRTTCELVLFHNPDSGFEVTAGLGGSRIGMFTIRHYDGKSWTYHKDAGDRQNLHVATPYNVVADVVGSRVSLSVNGVIVASADLTYTLVGRIDDCIADIPSSTASLWRSGFMKTRRETLNRKLSVGPTRTAVASSFK